MRRSLLAVALAAAFVVALLPPAHAQTSGSDQTVVTDPAGDQTVTAGTLVVTPPTMAQVDILDLRAAAGGGNVTLTVHTSAAVTATETVTLKFAVERGPNSEEGSTASGAAHTVAIKNGATTDIVGAHVTQSGATLALTFPFSAIGAVGGDQLTNFTVATQDTDGGSAPPPVTQDDSTGTDLAPNTGAGGPYILPRGPVNAGIELTITGGKIHQHVDCTPTGCGAAYEDTSFTGKELTTHDGNATITFDVKVTNTGTDVDTVNLGVGTHTSLADITLDKTSMPLPHGASADAHVMVALHSIPAASKVFDVLLQATSTRGATATVEGRIHTDHPTAAAPPAARKPVPEQLGFMTPMATGMGLDKALGDFAELALLASFILLAVVALYLIMFLTRTPWVRVQVTPKRATVAPGGTAEFRLRLSPRRKRSILARGVLHGETGTWQAGIQMGRGERMAPGTSFDMPLGGDSPDTMSGTLRVQVPQDAASNEKETIEFDVVPVDDKGAEHPAHRARAKVTVEAAPHTGYASARDIQLAHVRHDPSTPRPGATVTTTATIHNAGGIPATLRVVLLLDGKPILEQRIEVPAKSTKSAALPWTAGAGKNQVKVQVFLA